MKRGGVDAVASAETTTKRAPVTSSPRGVATGQTCFFYHSFLTMHSGIARFVASQNQDRRDRHKRNRMYQTEYLSVSLTNRAILRMRSARYSAVGGLLMLVVFQLACGYRVASTNRLDPNIRKISVLPLKNETTTFEVEQILTRALVRAFVERSSFVMVNDPSDADAVLTGVVSALNANPVVFGQETFGSTFLVTLNARVELRDRKTGKVLFKNDNYVFREQYVINVDVKNFFSELNPALGRIAEDFSSSVVSTILEGY